MCPKNRGLHRRHPIRTTTQPASGVKPIANVDRIDKINKIDKIHLVNHANLVNHVPKISSISCGATTSNCSYVQSAGFLSVRQRRKCAVCRKRSPCMCSYATSTTSSGLNGSHDKSFP